MAKNQVAVLIQAPEGMEPERVRELVGVAINAYLADAEYKQQDCMSAESAEKLATEIKEVGALDVIHF